MADTPDANVELAAGDDVDAKGVQASGLSMMETEEQPHFVYNMGHKKRGLFVIINNRDFDHKKTGMSSRSGTDADAANLYQTFKELDFEIHLFANKAVHEMLHIMRDASTYDHSNADCFGCAILSHGDEGVVYGTDGIVKVDELVEPLKGSNCPTLIGKPKIFIIQACRGSELDHGVEVADAAVDEPVEKKIYRIPHEADVLYCYSTVPGYFSWRNSTKGSWFIQSMCKMVKEYGKTRDFLWILTRVSYMVAYEFESNASKAFMNKKKQVPQVVSMMTKDLYFKDKGTPV